MQVGLDKQTSANCKAGLQLLNYALAYTGELSNQFREELKLLYKLKP